jgi:hypothetical protein
MKYKKVDQGYLIRIDKGEKIIESIIKFCTALRINSAWFTGIGSVSEISLAYFNVEKKEYSREKIEVPVEIVSLIGNATLFEGKCAVHAHVVVSNAKMDTQAGHLNEAIVSGTCEIFLRDLKTKIERKHIEEIGLNLLDI